MRSLVLLALLALLAVSAAQNQPVPAKKPLPPDIAARHAEGKWVVRRSELYRYAASIFGRHPQAIAIRDDYMKLRFIQDEGQRRGLQATAADVDAWLAELDRRVKEKSGGRLDLMTMAKQEGMTERALRRRARSGVLRERLALSEYRKRGDKRKTLPEADIVLAMDQLYYKAKKETAPEKLPPGVVARINDVEITDYDYGRELVFDYTAAEITRALNNLILVREAQLLLGKDFKPRSDNLRIHQDWYRGQLAQRLAQGGLPTDMISDDVFDQYLQSRGTTLKEVFASSSFLAEAAVRAHLRRTLGPDKLRKFYDENRARYGERLRVARLFLLARGPRQFQVHGKRVRTLEQGRQEAQAIWVRAQSGENFAELVRRHSDDGPKLKAAGGALPFWIHGGTHGYKITFRQARLLEPKRISKPYFNGNGFEIVKLLRREKEPTFENVRERVGDDVAEVEYRIWRRTVFNNSQRALTLTQE